jgi:high-affinity Fe2+/Pb2+ permease
MIYRFKMQTKKQSFIESLTNTFVGFAISFAATFLIFPLVGIQSSGAKNFVITLFFTVVSILRGYVIRRYFNKKVK